MCSRKVLAIKVLRTVKFRKHSIHQDSNPLQLWQFCCIVKQQKQTCEIDSSCCSLGTCIMFKEKPPVAVNEGTELASMIVQMRKFVSCK